MQQLVSVTVVIPWLIRLWFRPLIHCSATHGTVVAVVVVDGVSVPDYNNNNNIVVVACDGYDIVVSLTSSCETLYCSNTQLPPRNDSLCSA